MQMYRHKKNEPHYGKQTLKQLIRQNTGVSNFEINDSNIRDFSQTAKKCSIDFAPKKTDDRYPVFFKGSDADVLIAAFHEFTAKKLKSERKPSIRKDLAEKKVEAAKKTSHREKIKNDGRGIEL